MPTIPGLVLQLLQGAWDLAVAFIPLLYLGFLGYALGTERSVAAAVHSQHAYPLRYGVATIGGLIVGGISTAAIGGTVGLVVGGTVALAACLYSAMKRGVPGTRDLDLTGWRGRMKLLWLAVPFLAAAAVATGNMLLNHIVALAFLSTVFWEV